MRRLVCWSSICFSTYVIIMAQPGARLVRLKCRQGFLGSRHRLSRGSNECHWEHLQRQLLHLHQRTTNIIALVLHAKACIQLYSLFTSLSTCRSLCYGRNIDLSQHLSEG